MVDSRAQKSPLPLISFPSLCAFYIHMSLRLHIHTLNSLNLTSKFCYFKQTTLVLQDEYVSAVQHQYSPVTRRINAFTHSNCKFDLLHLLKIMPASQNKLISGVQHQHSHVLRSI